MNKWQQLARFVLEFTRDVVCLLLGVFLVLRATLDPGRYFYALMGGGITFIAPAVAANVRALLPGSDAGSLLESPGGHAPPPPSPSSSTSPEEHGEPGA